MEEKRFVRKFISEYAQNGYLVNDIIKAYATLQLTEPAKAKMVAKFLETVGRADVPIGIGIQHHNGSHRYDVWAKNYDLSAYP